MPIQKITSRANPRIKHVKRLMGDKEYRYRSQEYTLEGRRVLDGINGLSELFVREGTMVPSIAAKTVYLVDKNVFKDIASTEESQGIVAVAPLRVFDETRITARGRYILLDRLQDPGNMGSIIRSACAFGMNGIIITPGCVDPFSPKVVRAAASAAGKIDVIIADDITGLNAFTLIAADARGTDAADFKWPDHFILAIGNEGSGLSETICRAARAVVSVPIAQRIESLNAAVAAGILLYTSQLRRPV